MFACSPCYSIRRPYLDLLVHDRRFVVMRIKGTREEVLLAWSRLGQRRCGVEIEEASSLASWEFGRGEFEITVCMYWSYVCFVLFKIAKPRTGDLLVEGKLARRIFFHCFKLHLCLLE